MMEIKKNSLFTLKIENVAYGGRGIGRWEGVVVFVPFAVPGDVVEARLVKNKGNYIEADLVQVLEPSPIRIAPRCPYFGPCGGCSWQTIPYENQLFLKQEIARSSVEHLSGQSQFKLHPIIASPDIWRYRNKMDYTFGADADGLPLLGFHAKGSFTDVLDMEICHLQPEIFDLILKEVRAFAREKNLVPYNPVTHKGLLRHFMLRAARNLSEGEPMPVLAVLLTAEPDLPFREELLERLRRVCPSLIGFMHGLNQGMGDVFRLDRLLFQWGDDCLTERLEDLNMRISALSFFQTNTRGAELLYRSARDFLNLNGAENLLDAYCGAGSIGLFCARRCLHVYGIDIVREAIWDARENARQNGIHNATFLCGEMCRSLPLLLSRIPFGVQRAAVDPPSNGLDKKSLGQIIELGAPILVYVSCNPVTMARDAQAICESGYRITDIQPVDMFPHTYHIEIISRFEKI